MIASPLLFAMAVMSSCPTTIAFAPTKRYATGHTSKSITSSATMQQSKQSIHRSNTGRSYNMHVLFSNPDNEKEEADKKKSVSDEIFWAKQRALAAQMEANADEGLKQEQMEKFRKRSLALTSDTFYFSILIGCVLWLVAPNPFVTISYLFGALSGTAYAYGLGKYVESIGGSIDDADAEGAGVGQARFAFLILLFVVVGKFRSQGLLEIPSIMGFFTYQLASLGQGLREIDD